MQPLDVCFNHHLKVFVRKFDDRIRLDNLEIDIRSRTTIIKLFSLIWDQLHCPKFSNLIRYAWIRSGYADENITFQSALQICFPNNVADCAEIRCSDAFFIKCAHCDKSLCITHWFEMYHNHLDLYT